LEDAQAGSELIPISCPETGKVSGRLHRPARAGKRRDAERFTSLGYGQGMFFNLHFLPGFFEDAMSLWSRLIDLLVDCHFVEVVSYYLEDAALWKETRQQCVRCHKVNLILIEEAEDFWDEASKPRDYDYV
jgi:hypothetical protein